MRHLAAAQGHLVGAVGAEDQHPAARCLAAEVKQQAAGGGIHPVQVFEDQHQRPLPGNRVQRGGVLGKDRLLRDPRARLGARQRHQPLEPGRIRGGKGRRPLAHAFAGHKAADQVGGMLDERRERQRHGLPQPAGMLVQISPPAHLVSTSPDSIVKASRKGK